MSKLIWIAISAVGAVAWGMLALHRGETISAAWLVLAAVGTYIVGYRVYSRFLATRVFGLDDRRATPAERLDNGRDFIPTVALGAVRSPLRGDRRARVRWWVRCSPRSSAICPA